MKKVFVLIIITLIIGLTAIPCFAAAPANDDNAWNDWVLQGNGVTKFTFHCNENIQTYIETVDIGTGEDYQVDGTSNYDFTSDGAFYNFYVFDGKHDLNGVLFNSDWNIYDGCEIYMLAVYDEYGGNAWDSGLDYIEPTFNVYTRTRKSYAQIFQEGTTDGYADGYADGYEIGHDIGHDEGYELGESVGNDTGYTAGQTAGYSIGYAAGENVGYEEGYAIGCSDGMENADFMYDATNGIWHGIVEAYDTISSEISIFGITLGGIIATLGVILIVIFIVKLIKG